MPKVKSKVQSVLDDIFTAAPEFGGRRELMAPSYYSVKKLAGLIANDAKEEAFHQFFLKYPQYLFRATQYSDAGILGLLSKPTIGLNKADFAIFRVDQGSASVSFIELECPVDKLFIGELRESKELREGKTQLIDWDHWLSGNKGSSLNQLLAKLKDAPLFSEAIQPGNFRLVEPDSIERAWQTFGGNDYCHFNYLLVIGRWSKLTGKEKDRLLYMNSSRINEKVQIRTYEQFIRSAMVDLRFIG